MREIFRREIRREYFMREILGVKLGVRKWARTVHFTLLMKTNKTREKQQIYDKLIQ